MGVENAKEMMIKVHGVSQLYKVYGKNEGIYYFNAKHPDHIHEQLDPKVVTLPMTRWVISPINTQGTDKPLVALSRAIEQDKIEKDEALIQRIDINYKAMTLRQTTNAAIGVQKFVRSHRAKKVVEAQSDAAATKPGELIPQGNHEDSSVASSMSESLTGSHKKSLDSRASTPSDDESTYSLGGSSVTDDSEGSYVNKSGRSSFSSSVNSLKTKSGLNSREQDLYELLYNDDADCDPWSGTSKNLIHNERDNLSELSEGEYGPPPSDDESLPLPSPTLPTDDLNDLYRDLQAIVDILAQLKGNEPQLENVRKALNVAIEKTGGKVNKSLPEATVEPPNAGVAGVVTSPAPKADDIEENIRLLGEVKDKLAALLDNYQEQMPTELKEALVHLQQVVENSITEANTIKNTKDWREQTASARSASPIPLSPMSTDTPYTVKSTKRPEGQVDDMNHARPVSKK